MLRIVSESEDGAVNFWMKSFHPAVHHFRKAGELGNVFDGNFIVAQQRSRAAGGNDFDAHLRQSAGEIYNAVLVRNADQGPFDPAHCWYSS